MPSSFAWGAALPPLLLLLLLSLGCTPASGTVNKPNVIFMMVDDVGADRFSLYGGDTDVTPNFDSFADKATLFRSFFTQPICGPSRATLISGRYTSRSGVYGNGHKRYEELDESECTLGSVFMNADYTTAAFGKLHPAHRFLTNLTGICGFEHYVIWAREGPRFINSTIETNVGSSAVNTSSGMLDAMLNHNVDGVPRKLTLNGTYHPHFNRDMAKAFITSNKELDQPFFMYLPMMLAHGPLEDKPNDPSLPPGTDVPPDANDLFNERLATADAIIGDILQHLEDEGVADNTVVVVTSDNGTPRAYTSIVNGVEAPKGKRHAASSKGTRVPLLFYDPRLQSAPKQIRSVVSMYDMLPTLMDAAGISSYPAGKAPFDGQSVWKLLTGQRKKWPRWTLLFSETRAPHAVVRNKKFIITSDGEVLQEKKWYAPILQPPQKVCRKRKLFRRLRMVVEEAWRLNITFTLPGSSEGLAPYACSDIVCNADTSLPECVP